AGDQVTLAPFGDGDDREPGVDTAVTLGPRAQR
ncbi:MAG: hypothetical protein QOF97_2641, partial [Acidimicrobiaceae bacterium]